MSKSVIGDLAALHPDGTVCPSYSRPYTGLCDLIGTGAHANMTDFHHLNDEQVLTRVLGPWDTKHLIATGEERRIVEVKK